MIVFDCSTLVGAAIRFSSVPGRAFELARRTDTFALSTAVMDEIETVLSRPKLARFLLDADRAALLQSLRDAGAWFTTTLAVRDCRDPGDDKYLELALAAVAGVIVSSDADLLALHPWRGVPILRPAEYLALYPP